MQYLTVLKTNFENFNFIKPSEKFFDGRTIIYCLPVIRNIMRIATAVTLLLLARDSNVAIATDIEIKRNWIDIAKWAAGSFVADILPIAIFPYFGAISAIATLFALIFTCYEQYTTCKDVTPSKAWAILMSS